MAQLLRQCATLAALSVRTIPQRLALSGSVVLAAAMTILVFLGFSALSEGFRRTLQAGGSDVVAIVTRVGSESEVNSVLEVDQARLIETAPGVARVNGAPAVSGELYVAVAARKRSGGEAANLALRGVSGQALAVRPAVRLAAGRMFAPGSNEIVVGRGVTANFAGFALGRDVRLGDRNWRVVGVIEAPGTAFESEIWADVHVVQSLFRRGASVQSVRVRLTSPSAFAAFKQAVEEDRRLRLWARTERAFFASQAGATSELIGAIGAPLAVMMALGALAAALNALYNSVSARSAEIVTLRILGFAPLAALAGVMAEALLLTLIGGALGAGGYFALFNGATTSTMTQGALTQLVFSLQVSPAQIAQAFAWALAIGLIGGLAPGIAAARKRPALEAAQG